MRIRSVACSLPSRLVSNEDILAQVRKASEPHLSEKQMEQVISRVELLFRLAGAKHRHLRANGEVSRDFAVRAAQEALEKAELSPADIDLLIYVGVGRGWMEPGMSHYFVDALQLKSATCFDLLDACLSWLRALHISHHFLKDGVYRNIMVLNAEFNVQEYSTYAIRHPRELAYRFAQFTIGESATATVLSDEDCGIEPYFEFKTDASLHTLCKIPLPHIGQYSDTEKCPDLDPLVFFAYSSELFGVAQRMILDLYYGSAELKKREFDISFPHAASKTIVEKLDKRLGSNGRTVNVFEQFGNTVSASIPTAMCWAIENGRLKRGMKMLHVMGSAGFSVGFGHMLY